jgi:hypothetical protein
MRCGTFLEGKMEDTNKKDAVAGRRDFLKGSAVSVAAVGVAAVAGKSASAGEVEVVAGSGYRETEHVKAFYASARF